MPNKTCPRCGSPFVCRPKTPEICQCAGIVLSDDVRRRIRETYSDCLCRNCLIEIQNPSNQ